MPQECVQEIEVKKIIPLRSTKDTHKPPRSSKESIFEI